MAGRKPLSDLEKAIYEWQMWVSDFGEEGQEKLKAASVLISRCGGVGGAVALQLAAAGVGMLVLAHGGNLKPSDLNRQILMKRQGLGNPRVEMAAQSLRELNPEIEIKTVPENISPGNAAALIGEVDLVVDCAPLFEERFAMNAEAVRQRKPMVECAMYDLEAQVTTIMPGQGPCLRCIYLEAPSGWKRQFPVFGAVAGVAGSLGAMEAIKVLAGFGAPMVGRMVHCDLRTMNFRTIRTKRDSNCPVCKDSAGPLPNSR